MKKNKDTIFIAILAAAAVLTAVFTIFYVGSVRNPVILEREEAYIFFDGKDQVISGVYHFRNRLPMNTAMPLQFEFPTGDGLGGPLDWVVSFKHSTGENILAYIFSGETSIEFELALPPFGSGRLVVNYRQPVMGNRLGYIVKSGNTWGIARDGVTLYLNLPDGYQLADVANGSWAPATGTDWRWKMELPGDTSPEINIEFVRGD